MNTQARPRDSYESTVIRPLRPGKVVAGTWVTIIDPFRALRTCLNRDTGTYHGAGGLRLPEGAVDGLFTTRAYIAHPAKGTERVCIAWQKRDADGNTFSMWIDRENVQPAKVGRPPQEAR